MDSRLIIDIEGYRDPNLVQQLQQMNCPLNETPKTDISLINWA